MSNIMVSIGDIEGESTVRGYEKQIACTSMRHAIDLPVLAKGNTRVEGASYHGAIELTHSIDKASPHLRLAASAGRGKKLGKVTITRLRFVGGDPVVAELIMLSGAVVTRLDVDTPYDQTTGQPADDPVETFALEYAEILWDYKLADDSDISGSWSLKGTTSVSIRPA